MGRALPPTALPRPSYIVALARTQLLVVSSNERKREKPRASASHRAGGCRSHESQLPSRADVTHPGRAHATLARPRTSVAVISMRGHGECAS